MVTNQERFNDLILKYRELRLKLEETFTKESIDMDNKLVRYGYFLLKEYQREIKRVVEQQKTKDSIEKLKTVNMEIEKANKQFQETMRKKKLLAEEKQRKKVMVKEMAKHKQKFAYEETQNQIIKEQNRKEIRNGIKKWNKMMKRSLIDD